jgi:hypothetical protein
MSDQVVLITGALAGIGRAAAIIFAQEGARIVVSGRRDKEGQALVAELQGLGAEAIFVRTDVRKDEDVRNLVDQTVKRFGRLDITVNNAGTEGTPGPVTEQTAETYAATFRHKRPRNATEHEARIEGDAGTGKREHHQCLVGLWKHRGCRSVRLCGEQTRDRGSDKIRCTGSRRDRSSGKRSRSRYYRHWYAHALHQHRSK